MKKATITIRLRNGFEYVEGYTFECNGYVLAVHKSRIKNRGWEITDIRTGLALLREQSSRKVAVGKIKLMFERIGMENINQRMDESLRYYAL